MVYSLLLSKFVCYDSLRKNVEKNVCSKIFDISSHFKSNFKLIYVTMDCGVKIQNAKPVNTFSKAKSIR